MNSDYESLQKYLHEKLHPHILFKLRDEDGWDRAVGIENDTENGYVDIAHKRLKYWLNDPSHS